VALVGPWRGRSDGFMAMHFAPYQITLRQRRAMGDFSGAAGNCVLGKAL